VPEDDPRERIGFLWETALKPWERHIYRQVSGSSRFASIVFYRRLAALPGDHPFRLQQLSAPRYWRRQLTPSSLKRYLRKVYKKYVKRAPKTTYKGWDEALVILSRLHRLRLLHVFFGTKAVIYHRALQQLDIPVTVSFHGRDVGECLTAPRFSRDVAAMFRAVDCVMPRSHHMGRRLVEGGCPESKIWINRAGIPMNKFPLHPRRREPGTPLTFLQVCRLIPKKGVRDTIRAFGIVHAEQPNTRLLIAGEGESRPELESLVSEMALSSSVTFLGKLEPEQIPGTLHSADVFVHPSVTAKSGDQEGIPNSMLEAMATGLAPLVTRHAGIPEAVQDGVTGWLVDERSPEQLADRMIWCGRNLGQVARTGQAAHDFVDRNLSIEKRMRDLDEKYADLIEKNKNNRGR
jgi:glycosyltransferase involved in cell wall biosynthesis